MKINKKVNLAQLDAELNGKGLNAIYDENRKMTEITLADNNDASEQQLADAIAAHVAVFAELTIADKLENAGMNIDELKSALGL